MRPTESGLQTTLSGSQINPKARSLILWTERGAIRHAKLLNTEPSWRVCEKLEDVYFNQNTDIGVADLALSFREQFQLDKELRISIEAFGRNKQFGFDPILRSRIIRLCHRLGYEVPQSVQMKQRELAEV